MLTCSGCRSTPTWTAACSPRPSDRRRSRIVRWWWRTTPVRRSSRTPSLLGRRRDAHPGHARRAGLRMTPRAAVFCLHDVVPAERLEHVPATHRPYALAAGRVARALLIAARDTGRRAVPAGQVPAELGGALLLPHLRRRLRQRLHRGVPGLSELGLRATFFVVPTLVGPTRPRHLGGSSARWSPAGWRSAAIRSRIRSCTSSIAAGVRARVRPVEAQCSRIDSGSR